MLNLMKKEIGKTRKKDPKLVGGFTVLEMLVVLGISGALAAMFVGQGANLKDQVALFREEAKLIQALFQAKSFSLQARQVEGGGAACGYGVNLDEAAGELGIYAKMEQAGTCPDINDSEDWSYDSFRDEMVGSRFKLDNLVFIRGNSMKFVVFSPPRPEVIYVGDSTEGAIEICAERIPDFCRKIKVNSVGQITSSTGN